MGDFGMEALSYLPGLGLFGGPWCEFAVAQQLAEKTGWLAQSCPKDERDRDFVNTRVEDPFEFGGSSWRRFFNHPPRRRPTNKALLLNH